MTVYLDVERVIELHALGESAPLLDRATLEGAVARCQAGFGDQDAFPRLVDKAAALLHGIASTQCFQDGNKRAAWLSTVVFLELNGVSIPHIPDIEAEAFVMAVAVTAWPDTTVEKAAEWLQAQAERPRRHPQLDYVFLAQAGSMGGDGTFNALGVGTAGLLTSSLPYPLTIVVVCRVFWAPADVGRPHELTAEVFPDGSDEPIGGGSWVWEPPTPSGHAHHPHGLMPSLTAMPILGFLEEGGLYEVRVFLDGEPLASLPYNVVHNTPLELPS